VTERDFALAQDLEDIAGEFGIERIADLERLDLAPGSAKDGHRFDEAFRTEFIGSDVETQDLLGDGWVFEEMARWFRDRVIGDRAPRGDHGLLVRFSRSLQLPDDADHNGCDERETTRERRQAAPRPVTPPLLLGLAPVKIRTAAPFFALVLYQIAAVLSFNT